MKAYSFGVCLFHLAMDHASSLSRQSTVPVRNTDTSTI